LWVLETSTEGESNLWRACDRVIQFAFPEPKKTPSLSCLPARAAPRANAMDAV
jgi:hypothetical protein